MSRLLLSLGWQGVGFDLSSASANVLTATFAEQIAAGRYEVRNEDWIRSESEYTVDLVISCMVMEHFNDADEEAFIEKARASLRGGGTMICIVPGSPNAWGIEDDIAGHMRRYTAALLRSRFSDSFWSNPHIVGLTFPISNILLPVSNFLVHRSEKKKLALSMQERTEQSGIRNVPMKTDFPSILGWLLNESVMMPLHILQKLFSGSKNSLVLYAEAKSRD